MFRCAGYGTIGGVGNVVAGRDLWAYAVSVGTETESSNGGLGRGVSPADWPFQAGVA